MRRLCLVLGATLGAVSWGPSPAATLRVPGDYPYICPAIRAAQYGDTVLVAPGTYDAGYLGCTPLPDGVVITSEAGPAVTVIHAYWFDGALGIFEFEWFSTHQRSELSGFTIVPMDCNDCNMIACFAGASPLIRNNVIVPAPGPSQELFVAIASFDGGSPRILSNTIVGASNAIQFSGVSSTPIISHNIMVYGLGGTSAIICASGSTPEISCNEIWGFSRPYSASCAPAQGDFFEDPLFCAPDEGDYSLREDSPAVHGYGCGLVGALPVGCDATSAEGRSWGLLKQLFR